MKKAKISKSEKKVLRENIKKTKKNLHALSKSSKNNFFRSTGRILKYGTKSFARNIWLSIAATLVMSITLILLFLTVIASIILSNTADSIRDKIDIAFYFRPETSVQTLAELKEIILSDANVKEAVVKTSAEEYALLLEANNDNEAVVSVLEDKSMDLGKIVRDSTPASMHIKVYDAENLTSINTLVEENETFSAALSPDYESDYELNHAEISTINSWAKIAKNGGIILCLIFLVISTLIVFNTVRMAIFSRREEIYMMNLVGADKSFISGPFLVEAQMSGLIAGIIGATASYFLLKLIEPKLTSYGIDTSFIELTFNSNYLIFVFIAMILLGIIIGSFAANLATHHYLRKAK